MRNDLFIYAAKVNRVIDGDTVVFDVDLGFNVTITITTRLSRINAPESNRKISKVKGLAARDYLIGIMMMGPLLIQSSKPFRGKYGRWLVEILVEIDGEYWNVNDQMVEDGHAIFQKY